ncbi:hypothetical protein AALO_G00020230 [Alosa alosa]|uniref:Uncharacterized protein n=1 Tax=Alosa alosa TaxID=278164 RepID=A0AAV6HD45_9TELE|nr:hypothetical protein AALO_G00020230 [Alosa alosa]
MHTTLLCEVLLTFRRNKDQLEVNLGRGYLKLLLPLNSATLLKDSSWKSSVPILADLCHCEVLSASWEG